MKPSPRYENRGDQDRTFSIFIDNLLVDLDNLGLKILFSDYGVVMNAYVPNKVGRRSVRKYGFVRFGEKEKGEKAIEGMNGKFVGGHKLDVAWARFQKRPDGGLVIRGRLLQKRWFGNGFSKRILERCLMWLPKMWRTKTFKWLLN